MWTKVDWPYKLPGNFVEGWCSGGKGERRKIRLGGEIIKMESWTYEITFSQ